MLIPINKYFQNIIKMDRNNQIIIIYKVNVQFYFTNQFSEIKLHIKLFI